MRSSTHGTAARDHSVRRGWVLGCTESWAIVYLDPCHGACSFDPVGGPTHSRCRVVEGRQIPRRALQVQQARLNTRACLLSVRRFSVCVARPSTSLGGLQEAIVDAETALKLESDDIRKIKPLYRLACGLHAWGNAGRAREVLLLAMAMVPTEEAAREFEDLFQQCEYTLRDQMPYVSIKDSRVQVRARAAVYAPRNSHSYRRVLQWSRSSCPAGSNSSSCGSAGRWMVEVGSTSEMPCNATATGSSSTSVSP